jgi:uncharacterized SAM-binding protein YcdF (DUF218 family)
MIIVLMFIWLFASLILNSQNKQNEFRVTMSLGLIVFITIGYGLPTQWLLRSLQAATVTTVNEWKPRNIILVLGFGAEQVSPGVVQVPLFGYSRVARAALLYRGCKLSGAQCAVLVSGGDPRNFGKSEAQVYAVVLKNLGIAEADLILEDKSQNTWENAKLSAVIVASIPHDQLVLVSSGTHLQRSLLYAAHFGLIPDIAVRADHVSVIHHGLPQAYNFLLFDLVMHELLGILRFNVYESMGWNGAAVETHLKAVY